MPQVVEVRGLTKFYGRARGVEDVSFQVAAGEIFGFLGPNGAGKTTTIRLLMGLLRPSAGEMRLLGQIVPQARPAIHGSLGYLPGDLGLPDRWTAREYFAYLARLRRLRSDRPAERLARRFALDLDRPLRSMSHGNRRKVGLVQAFMHDPPLLILDEPTSGLDPIMQEEFHELVRETRARGKTVFLSSHNLPEVEELCDRVAIIRDGRLLDVLRVDDVRSKALRQARIRFGRMPPLSRLRALPGVSNVRRTGDEVVCDLRGPAGSFVAVLGRLGVLDLHFDEPSLETVFLRFYRGRHR